MLLSNNILSRDKRAVGVGIEICILGGKNDWRAVFWGFEIQVENTGVGQEYFIIIIGRIFCRRIIHYYCTHYVILIIVLNNIHTIICCLVDLTQAFWKHSLKTSSVAHTLRHQSKIRIHVGTLIQCLHPHCSIANIF